MKLKLIVNRQTVNLSEVAGDVVDTVMEAAMRSPAERLKLNMQMLAPKDTGALRQSIDFLVKTYAKNGSVVAIVGPKRQYRLNGRRPTKYAHLVEFGHVTVAPEKGKTIRKENARKISFVAPRPFMRVAVQAARNWAGSDLATGVEAKLQTRIRYAPRVRYLTQKP